MDATENPALAKQFEVKSYPTLKFLCQGAVSDYTGARTADSIVTWVREHSTADLTVVESLKEMEALASSSVVTLMAYVGGLNHVDAQAFSKSVVCSKGFALGITTNADVAAKVLLHCCPDSTTHVHVLTWILCRVCLVVCSTVWRRLQRCGQSTAFARPHWCSRASFLMQLPWHRSLTAVPRR